jgi:hypothetical protein
MDIPRTIRALLAKAASTTSLPEAEALTAKAHELMTRHAVAAAAVSAPDTQPDPVAVAHVDLDQSHAAAQPPFRRDFFLLLQLVAEACGCRAFYAGDARHMEARAVLVGHPDDTAFVAAAYATLKTAVTAAARQAWADEAHAQGLRRGSQAGRRRFTRGFIAGFADRMAHRLTHQRTPEARTLVNRRLMDAERHARRLFRLTDLPAPDRPTTREAQAAGRMAAARTALPGTLALM